MKKFIIIALVIAAAALGVYFYSVQSAKKAAVGAADACNAAVQEYNEKIEPYNEAAAQTALENEKLQTLLDSAQADIDKGEKAYEEDTLEDLEMEVKKASKKIVEVPAQIDALKMVDSPDSYNKKELEEAKQAAEKAEAAARKAMKKIPKIPEVPDYSKEIKAVGEAQKAYRDSVQKLANVTAPADGFVAERLRTVRTVTATAVVSEGHDPNRLLGKEDGYIGCVYFRDERIDSESLPEEVFYREGWPSEEESTEEESEEESAEETTEEPEEEETAEESSGGQSTEEETTEEGSEGQSLEEEAAEDGTSEKASEGASEKASPEELPEDGSSEESASGAGAEAAAEGDTASSQAEAASTGAASAEQEASVSPEALAVIAAGTAGGGAVEIYTTKKEAKERDEYLAYFAGSVMDPGAHMVEGTCVIRASRYLEETEQLELMEEIRQALLKVE